MKVHEYQAKEIFKAGGIPTPQSIVAETPEEAREAAGTIKKPVAIKSQVLIGGRGKAGGIKFADNPEMTYQLTKKLLGSTIRGETVRKVLVEEMLDIQDELYLSVAVDRSARKPLIMASKSGGVDIEQVASTTPDKIYKYHQDPLEEFMPYQAREIARKMGVDNELISPVGGIIWKLYQIFLKYDANIAEINPLVLTNQGVIAADAYGIPSLWIKLSDRVLGGNFKFRDYILSVGRKQMEPFLLHEEHKLIDILNSFEDYKIQISLDKLLDSCPFKDK